LRDDRRSGFDDAAVSSMRSTGMDCGASHPQGLSDITQPRQGGEADWPRQCLLLLHKRHGRASVPGVHGTVLKRHNHEIHRTDGAAHKAAGSSFQIHKDELPRARWRPLWRGLTEDQGRLLVPPFGFAHTALGMMPPLDWAMLLHGAPYAATAIYMNHVATCCIMGHVDTINANSGVASGDTPHCKR
jgi:hypothetical protein